MLPTWIFSKRAQPFLAAAAVAAAPFFGFELAPDAVIGGMLLVWGLGHCDTLDGPVVALARKALEERNVNHVLPWVRAQDEPEVRRAFEHAQAVRELGPKARDLADRHFFETVVRIHRTGEGEGFTGLKPAGLDLGPAIPAADRALETGSPDELLKLLVDALTAGVRARFHEAAHKKEYDPNDVAGGRRYVEAYVTYAHYVETLWVAASGEAHHHHAEAHEEHEPLLGREEGALPHRHDEHPHH